MITPAERRRALIERLGRERFDLLVIGGGVDFTQSDNTNAVRYTADVQWVRRRSPEVANRLHLPIDGGGAAAGGGFDATCESGGTGAYESQAGSGADACGDRGIAIEFLRWEI